MKYEDAEFEICVDGKRRSCRDTLEVALEAAQYLKGKNPHVEVSVRDLRTNISTAVAWKAER
jgi:hypothetical protein